MLESPTTEVFQRFASHHLQTTSGALQIRGYEANRQILILAATGPQFSPERGCSVRVQLACLYGEALRSIDCDCALQIDAALRRLQGDDTALVIYFPSMDGRGTGLKSKLLLSEAEERLNLPPYEAAVASGLDYSDYSDLRFVPRVLHDYGVTSAITLLSENTLKADALRRHGVAIANMKALNVDTSQLSALALRDLGEKHRRSTDK